MNVRQWLNQNAIWAASGAVALLLVAIGVLWWQQGDATPTMREVYFWDMETDEVFTRRMDAVPPIEAPSGGQGVRAHLYSCGECTPEQWIGYLETYTDEAKRMHQQRGTFPEGDDHLLVRALDGGQWVPHGAAEADDILAVMYEQCPDPVECLP